MTLRHAAAVLPFFAACYAHAADDSGSKAAAPQTQVVSVQAVTTDDPTGYAIWVAKANEDLKSAGGPANLTHVFQGVIAGEESGKVFAVRFADSAMALAKTSEALMKLPERSELMLHLGAIRKLGASSMLQAVHFEGGYAGEWVFITDAQVKDEAAYVKGLGELRTLFDDHGLKDIKVNLYRVIAGRSNHTHEAILSAPSEERNAALMDSIGSPWMTDWLSGMAGVRTVVANGIYREISK